MIWSEQQCGAIHPCSLRGDNYLRLAGGRFGWLFFRLSRAAYHCRFGSTMLRSNLKLNFSGGCNAPDANLRHRCHMPVMTTYTIIPTPDGSGFHVGVVGADGARQTMLGFASEADAESWILHDKRLNMRHDSPKLPASAE